MYKQIETSIKTLTELRDYKQSTLDIQLTMHQKGEIMGIMQGLEHGIIELEKLKQELDGLIKYIEESVYEFLKTDDDNNFLISSADFRDYYLKPILEDLRS